MLVYKPRIKTFMLKNLTQNTPVDYYPKNEQMEVICEMKEILQSFAICNRGLIETKNSLYYYDTICRCLENSKNEEKMFVVISTDLNYSEELFNECIKKIESIFQSDNVLSHYVFISPFRKQIYELIQGYFNADPIDLNPKLKPKQTKFDKDQNTEIVLQTDFKQNLIENDELITNVNHTNEKNIHLINDYANEKEKNHNNNKIEDEANDNSFNQDNLVYQKLKPWKTIKIIYIVICLIYTISVIISIFFLKK